ncbi:MAG: serine hydrolase domain-containing protein [Pseudomonadota bacterium]
MRQQASFAALLTAALLALSGCGDPTLDPQFAEQLSAAKPDEVGSLIESEAKRLDVTAMNIAIVDGDGPAQVYHFGRAKPGGLMQVASLSKTVAAAVILTHAQRQSVGLDDDIRTQVTSVDIAALEGGNRPVTLRQLLSHTTGSSQSGYPGYPRGYDFPNAAEVVDNPPRFFESALVFDGEPGEFRYSGGGYMIAQLWAEDTSGKAFEHLARELVFEPLGMEKSTFAQPIDPEAIAPLQIIGADAGLSLFQGVFAAVEDSWHVYPEQAAAGLWTTATDYAIFASALLQAAEGNSDAIPQAVARAMITKQADMGEGRAYGLGTMLRFAGNGALKSVSHTGANTGYRAYFAARPASREFSQRIVVSIANTTSGESLNAAIVDALLEK